MKKTMLFLVLLAGWFSCSKNDLRNDIPEGNTLEIIATSKNIHFTTDQMAAISMNGEPTKNDGSKIISVFPLKIDNKETEIYAVVNYSDTTTLLTTKFVNYPYNFIAFFDKMAVDSVTRTIADVPEVLSYSLKAFDNDIRIFAADANLVKKPLGFSSTKMIDDEFMPPPGCRVEIETTSTYGKSMDRIGPLTKTVWGQGYPYNAQVFPNLIGCVGIAIGQLIRFHEHPQKMPYYKGGAGDIPYSSMPHNTNNTENQSLTYNNTAPFLKYIAEEIETDFGETESPANLDPTGRNFLRRYYNVTVKEIGSRFQPKHMSEVREEMRRSQPIAIRGSSDGSGHAWLIDGYDQVATMATQIYRYYDQNNHLIYIQHLENPIAQFYCFHHNLGWYGASNTWLNAYADLSLGNYTFNGGVKVLFVSKL